MRAPATPCCGRSRFSTFAAPRRDASELSQPARRLQLRPARFHPVPGRADRQGAVRAQRRQRSGSSRPRRCRLHAGGRCFCEILARGVAAHARRVAPGHRRASRAGLGLDRRPGDAGDPAAHIVRRPAADARQRCRHQPLFQHYAGAVGLPPACRSMTPAAACAHWVRARRRATSGRRNGRPISSSNMSGWPAMPPIRRSSSSAARAIRFKWASARPTRSTCEACGRVAVR